MAASTTIRLRDRRMPGHGWFDNEIYDVFGDELGQHGISVYITLTRLCYGVSVRMSLREMAGHARMNKDTFARSLKRVIALGLVIERKGATAQSASCYDLVDVKALAVDYLRSAEAKRRSETDDAAAKVSCYQGPTLVELMLGKKAEEDSLVTGSVDDTTRQPKCLTVRQMVSAVEDTPKKIYVSQAETEVSQMCTGFETEVSHDVRHPLRQDTRLTKTQDKYHTPYPRLERGDGRAEPEERDAKAPVSLAVHAAVSKVARECNLSEGRIVRAIERAMLHEASKTGGETDFNAIAELMIREQRHYVAMANRGMLRYTVRMARFFGEMWRDEGLWGIDFDKVRQERSAQVGVYRA